MAAYIRTSATNEHQGYAQFTDDEGNKHGSFEVFYVDEFSRVGDTGSDGDYVQRTEPQGWYWWACFPGCTPDGEANGPFDTAKAAYEDAQGDAS